MQNLLVLACGSWTSSAKTWFEPRSSEEVGSGTKAWVGRQSTGQ